MRTSQPAKEKGFIELLPTSKTKRFSTRATITGTKVVITFKMDKSTDALDP